MQFISAETFEQWRSAARGLITSDVPPEAVSWSCAGDQLSLFCGQDEPVATSRSTTAFAVPNKFLELANTVACHCEPQRWELLYRTLWRLKHGEQHLREVETDDDVYRLSQMRKAVTRDVRKMKAFVCFRKIDSDDGVEAYAAWHRPDHRIVRLAGPFFTRRFQAMNWTIFTPSESVTWWKWKVAPYTIDAVLIYARKGHGERASLFTDYTFALWDGEALVPFAKAYSGLDDAKIRKIDRYVRRKRKSSAPCAASRRRW